MSSLFLSVSPVSFGEVRGFHSLPLHSFAFQYRLNISDMSRKIQRRAANRVAMVDIESGALAVAMQCDGEEAGLRGDMSSLLVCPSVP